MFRAAKKGVFISLVIFTYLNTASKLSIVNALLSIRSALYFLLVWQFKVLGHRLTISDFAGRQVNENGL